MPRGILGPIDQPDRAFGIAGGLTPWEKQRRTVNQLVCDSISVCDQAEQQWRNLCGLPPCGHRGYLGTVDVLYGLKYSLEQIRKAAAFQKQSMQLLGMAK